MELGLRKPSRSRSKQENDSFVVNATFESQPNDAEGTTGPSSHGRSPSASSICGEQHPKAEPEQGFFWNGHRHSQVDPKILASRPSDQMMQDQRLLGHQVLYRDRVFSDSGMCFHGCLLLPSRSC